MILFQNDWLKYPGAVIHYETKNESFLRTAEIYYQMGIENNAFHLSLLDPDLRFIDPLSDNLSLLEKAKVTRECKLNFWYYLREVSRVPEPGSVVPIPFGLNRMNAALYWLFFNHVMAMVVILRQTGKTTTLAELVKYLMNFGAMNTFINFLTKNESLKAETFRKIKALYEELPDYLNFSTKKDIFNTDEIHIKGWDNKVKGSLSSSSPKQAEKVGRGFTAGTNLVDEAGFIENLAIALGALLMSGNAARSAAERNGNAYGTILATTAANIDDRDGGYAYSILTGSTVWDEKFLDLPDLKTLNELVYKNSAQNKNQTKIPIVSISMSYRQLGLSDEWLEKKKRENISTPENLKRDLYNQWLSGSTASPLPKGAVDTLRDNQIDQPFSDWFAPFNYLMKWYIPDDEIQYRIANGHSFIVGIDTSDGVGGDDIAFNIRDHVIGDVVGTSTFNEINLITLADFFVAFLIKYENSTMIIERKSSAIVIIDYLIQKLVAAGINPFKRLYNTIVQEKAMREKEYQELCGSGIPSQESLDKHRKYIGFTTSASGATARSDLFSGTLMSMLKYTAYCTYDRTLIDQIAALVIKNGRIDHPPGGNDDHVVAALLSFWLLINGKNLQTYGINTSMILKANNVYLDEKYQEDETAFDREEMMRQEADFNQLLEEFKKETDPVVSRQIELKIHRIATQLKTANKVISVEEMLESIAREKRLQRRSSW